MRARMRVPTKVQKAARATAQVSLLSRLYVVTWSQLLMKNATANRFVKTASGTGSSS